MTGIDLGFSNLRDADFSNTTFDTANLTGVQSDGATFIDASFVDVNATRAIFDDATGADFTNAMLAGADLALLGQVTLAGADLYKATISAVFTIEDPPPIAIDLSGIDLRGVDVRGPFLSSPSVVTSLEGALVDDRTGLYAVDLTDAVLGDVDISVVSVDDRTLCPVGYDNTGDFSGNCVRTE